MKPRRFSYLLRLAVALGLTLPHIGSTVLAVAEMHQPVASAAASVKLYATGDAYVDMCMPAVNRGNDNLLRVARDYTEFLCDYHVVIRFNLAAIPAGAELTSAALLLHQNSQYSGGGSRTMYIADAFGNWSEGSVNWDNRPVASTDLVPATVPTGVAWRQYDVTKVVRKWVEEGLPNDGFVLIPSASGEWMRSFDSSEVEGWGPYLAVSYTLPTLTPTQTRTPTRTRTPTATPTHTPSYTPTATPTSAPTQTLTPTHVPTDTPVPTGTPTQAPTYTAKVAVNVTTTRTPTGTPGPPVSPTHTPKAPLPRGGTRLPTLLVVLAGGLLGGGMYLLWRAEGHSRGRGDGERRVAPPGAGESYYYVNGSPVSLQRRDDLIAIKFKGIDSQTAAASSGAGADVPGYGPLAAADCWPGGEVVLRRLPGEAGSPKELQALLVALNQRADIERASFVYELNPGDGWIATDRFVAQFPAGMSERAVAAVNRRYGVEEVERISWLPGAYLVRVTPASPGDALSVANAYVESEHAIFAHPNFLRKYANRAHLLQPEAAQGAHHWHLSAIEAFEAWRISSGSPDVAVAIIDDGADVDHLAFPNQAGEHFNVIDQSDDPRPPAERAKEYAHGTACAGLAVGASNQVVGTSGVAPGCRLMGVRLLDRVLPVTVQEKLEDTLTDEEQVALQRALSVVNPYREARALQWACEHGADVISNSWGPPDGYAKYGKSFPIDDITRMALTYTIEHGRGGKGCIICWAAGNGNESISSDGYASHPDVLAVGACTVESKRAPYSDYGPEVDICAPGGGYHKGLLTTVDVDPDAHQAYRHDFNGTSAAAPIVAAVAALVLSVNPNLSREEVYDILRSTADRIDLQGGQYDQRGHSPFYGWGRVNARRAVQEATARA